MYGDCFVGFDGDGIVRMRRGLSTTLNNRSVVSRVRRLVVSDVVLAGPPSTAAPFHTDADDDDEEEDQPSLHIAETPVYTFVLPNINIYPDGFKAFLYKQLIETATLVSLEQAGLLCVLFHPTQAAVCHSGVVHGP